MPNIKSSKKSVKVIAKKTEANHEYIAKVKNYIKKCEKAIVVGNKEDAAKSFLETKKAIDKAISKNLMKKQTADRQKSRLSAKVKAMQ